MSEDRAPAGPPQKGILAQRCGAAAGGGCVGVLQNIDANQTVPSRALFLLTTQA